MSNKTFYAKARSDRLSFGDIFSDMFKKHSREDGARLFMAGTPLTTPSEADMLAQWVKPYMFLRLLGLGAALTALLLIVYLSGIALAIPALLVIGSFVMPLAVLMFFWELNIPRNIPLYHVLLVFFIGGALSLIVTSALSLIINSDQAALAALYEEPAKLIALALFVRKADRRYILNGMLIGAAVGAGFAAIESAGYSFYLSDGLMSTMLLRSALTPGGHVAWAALYGGALVWAKGGGVLKAKHLVNGRFLLYFLAAVVLHMLWNSGIELLFPCAMQLLLTAAVWALLFIEIKAGLRQITGRSASGAVPSGALSVVALTGPYAGMQFTIAPGECVVAGRDPRRANLVFPGSATVSGAHCRLDYGSGGLTITDLSSTNGTFIAGQRLSPGRSAVLGRGAQFMLGSQDAVFRVE